MSMGLLIFLAGELSKGTFKVATSKCIYYIYLYSTYMHNINTLATSLEELLK